MTALEGITLAAFLDTAAVVLLLLGGVQGLRRGLSGELARLLSMLLVLAGGLYAYEPCGAWLEAHSRLGPESSRAVVFLGAVLVLGGGLLLLRFVLGKVMQVVFEPTVNRIGGVLAGVLRAAAFVALAFLVLYAWPHDYLRRTVGEDSFVGRHVVKLAPIVEAGMEDLELKEAVDDVEKTMKGKR